MLSKLLSWLHIGLDVDELPVAVDGSIQTDEPPVELPVEVVPPIADDVQFDDEGVSDPVDDVVQSDDEGVTAAGDGDVQIDDGDSTQVVVDVPPALSADDVTTSFAAGYMSGYLDGYADTPASDQPTEYELVGVETYALSPITSSTGLKGVLIDVIGPYDNIVTQFSYRPNTSSNLSYVNEVTPDYPWIGSCLIFTVLLVALFRLAGRLIWRR